MEILIIAGVAIVYLGVDAIVKGVGGFIESCFTPQKKEEEEKKD